jgi:CDP-diacylglycerol---glycerol-3-phosphate 3-phosphatidyltransferase
VIGIALAFRVRLAFKGRVHFDRVERQGESRLLTKGAMELAHWGLEPVAQRLALLGVTPNAVSWGSLGLGFLAGVFLAWGHFGFGAVSATAASLLDLVDGMVARISGVASDAGEVLDAAVDRYVEFFFLAGLAIYYREFPLLQMLALFALLGSFMVSYSTAKAEALDVDPPSGSMRRPERAVYLILGAALSALSVPLFEAAGDSSLPIAYPMVLALGFVGLVANVSSIRRLRAIVRAVRTRQRDPKHQSSGTRDLAAHQEAAVGHEPAGIQF